MKKIVALLLAVLMVAGLMAACGKENSEPTWNSGGVSELPQQTQPQETDDVSSSGDVESFPATDGDVVEFDYSDLPATDGDLND